MRPADIVKEGRIDSQPCLFSGAANPSDVCQVWVSWWHVYEISIKSFVLSYIHLEYF